MPMNTKRRRILRTVAKGGMSQADIAAMLHVSKRDVSLALKIIRDHNLIVEDIDAMSDVEIAELGNDTSSQSVTTSSNYLIPDMAALVKRKKKSRRLPVKQMWYEYVDAANKLNKASYSYQTFAKMFALEAERTGAVRHFNHEPGAKVYIDWAGDVAFLTDRISGQKSKIYLFVMCLPFSSKLFSCGFMDMKQKSWHEGHIRAFEYFGGVPRMLVPDNCSTATNRTAPGLTLINQEYERFAEHYGAAVVPTRVRKPRDKSVGESAVDLVEQWIIAPANELVFYTLDAFNAYCAQRVNWLNSRPFSAKDGSRNSIYEQEELPFMLTLPVEPYETCEWRRAKVGPDYCFRYDQNEHFDV